MKRYTAAELAFVKRRRKMPRVALHAAFRRKFPRRRDVTVAKIKSLCDDRGWRVGSLKGRRKGQSSKLNAIELAFIKRRRKMPRRDLHTAFVTEFRRSDVSYLLIKKTCTRNGWRAAPDWRRRALKGRTKFSRDELAFIRRRAKTPRAQLHREFNERFGRRMTFGAFKNFCKRFKAFTGRTGRFNKGIVPWSKGKKLGTRGNSARTQFKKGQLPHNAKFAGHEYIDKQTGFVLVSIEETSPWRGTARHYVPKQHVLWREQRGQIPKGMVLKCKGAASNPDPSNWELVPRGVLPRLNNRWGRNYETAPAELKPTIMAIAKLEHQVAERKRRAST
jgi:hypothetical protein